MKRCLFPFLSFTALSTPALSELTSLYGGAEKTLSSRDRQRVVTILESFGVDYVLDSQRHILVPESSRASIQDIVARSMTQSLRVQPEVQAQVDLNAAQPLEAQDFDTDSREEP